MKFIARGGRPRHRRPHRIARVRPAPHAAGRHIVPARRADPDHSTFTVTDSGTFSTTQFESVHTLSDNVPLIVTGPALDAVNGIVIAARFSVRDTLRMENTPIDYLDFASPISGLGGKMGLDATNKFPGETNREWGTPIVMDGAIKQRIDAIWQGLGI